MALRETPQMSSGEPQFASANDRCAAQSAVQVFAARLAPEGVRGDDSAVTEVPETRYAWNGDVALAYQVMGEGPIDIVYIKGYVSNVDLNWESPRLSRFLRGLAAHARLIVTDRRGWGCSDRSRPSTSRHSRR